MSRVLLDRPDPSWLPRGSRAEVVAAEEGDDVPSPTALVRLLARRTDSIWTVARRQGPGRDLPTRLVTGSVSQTLRDLTEEVLGAPLDVQMLGWVHNRVPGDPADYEWPSPDAFFTVWTHDLARDAGRAMTRGIWLGPAAARAELADRHWWPLAQALADSLSGSPS